MKKSLLVAALCAVVGLAFAVGQLTADGLPPGTSVMRATEVTIPVVTRPVVDRIQGEYKTVQTNIGDLPGDQLEQLGNEGWEMCGVRQRGQAVAYFYFKREKLPGANPGNQPAIPPTTYKVEPFRNEPANPTAPPPAGYGVPQSFRNAEPANEPAPTPATHTEYFARPVPMLVPATEPKVNEAK